VPVIEGFGFLLREGALGHRGPAAALSAPAADGGLRAAHLLLAQQGRAFLYDTVFAGAARVLIVPPPTHGAQTHHQSSFEEILARTAATGVPVEGVRTAEEAARALGALKGDEVVLLLSSGPLLGCRTACRRSLTRSTRGRKRLASPQAVLDPPCSWVARTSRR